MVIDHAVTSTPTDCNGIQQCSTTGNQSFNVETGMSLAIGLQFRKALAHQAECPVEIVRLEMKTSRSNLDQPLKKDPVAFPVSVPEVFPDFVSFEEPTTVKFRDPRMKLGFGAHHRVKRKVLKFNHPGRLGHPGCGAPSMEAYRTLKYRAWGWCTTIALVDCSGSSWNSSVSSTPILSGLRSVNSFVWSSRFGQAGYPKL